MAATGAAAKRAGTWTAQLFAFDPTRDIASVWRYNAASKLGCCEVVMQAPTLQSLIARDGTKLIADVWNVNANSTLLLLPAGAETRTVWHSVVDHFSPDLKKRWRFVAADYRGHGDSGRSESYLFKDFTDDLLTW